MKLQVPPLLRGATSHATSLSYGRMAVWIGIAVVAIVIRFWRLGASDPQLDEAWSLIVSSPPLPEVLRLCAENNNSPLHYVVLHAIIVGFEPTWWALRAPSALASAVTLLPVCLLANHVGGRRAALAAGVLFALSPLSVFYAQTARTYALLALLAAGGVYAFLRRTLWWGVIWAVAAYCHPLAVILLPGIAVAAACAPAEDRRRAMRVAAGGAALGIAVWAPWLPIAFAQTGENLTEYLGEIWARWNVWFVGPWSFGLALGIEPLPRGVQYLRIGPAYPPALQTVPGRLAIHGLTTVTGGVILWAAARHERVRELAGLFVGTLAAHILLSEFVRPVLLLGRHDSTYIPLVVALVCAALWGDVWQSRRARAARLTLFALILAINAWWTLRYVTSPPHVHQPFSNGARDPAD